MSNRLSAQRSRNKKMEYTAELEKKVKELEVIKIYINILNSNGVSIHYLISFYFVLGWFENSTRVYILENFISIFVLE